MRPGRRKCLLRVKSGTRVPTEPDVRSAPVSGHLQTSTALIGMQRGKKFSRRPSAAIALIFWGFFFADVDERFVCLELLVKAQLL